MFMVHGSTPLLSVTAAGKCYHIACVDVVV